MDKIMKVDWLKLVLLAMLGALAAWDFSLLCEGALRMWVMAACVFASLTAGSVLLSLKAEPRVMINLKALGLSYMCLAAVMNLAFTFFEFTTAGLVIPNGIVFISVLLIARQICKSEV